MNPELKTLKELISWEMEFDGEIDSVPVVSKLDVKVEAIKHIQKMKKDIPEGNNPQEIKDIINGLNGAINWIKHFFGITEGELK